MNHNNSLSLSILSSHCWINNDQLGSVVLPESLSQNADFDPISLKQIPPIKRRRLNVLSKMAMHTSLICTEQANIDPSQVITVFASQHGELNRTIKIVNSMISEQEVSPKDFSLSVHNSALGLFSIFNNNKCQGTSIAAGGNTFGYALLESYNYLTRFPQKNVLLTCFDLQVSEPFDQLQDALFPGHSCSLLLSLDPERGQRLSFNFNRLDAIAKQNLPLELNFFDYWYSNQQASVINSTNTAWEFRKDAV